MALHAPLDGMPPARRQRSFGVNAVVELFQHGAPSVIHSQVDAKQRLELQVKEACEEFIMYCTDLVARPVLSIMPQQARAPSLRSRTSSRYGKCDAAGSRAMVL